MTRSDADYERILRESGCAVGVAERWGPALGNVLSRRKFSSGDVDLVDFLATILHESQMLTKMRESGRYSAARIVELGMASPAGSRWRSLVPRAEELASTRSLDNSVKFFEAVYGGRMGNGPEGSGDGSMFAGTGPLGVTGRANFQWLADQSGQDITLIPLLLQQPIYALGFCMDWWEAKVPDSILGDDRKVRRVVNGGSFGLGEVAILVSKVRRAL